MTHVFLKYGINLTNSARVCKLQAELYILWQGLLFFRTLLKWEFDPFFSSKYKIKTHCFDIPRLETEPGFLKRVVRQMLFNKYTLNPLVFQFFRNNICFSAHSPRCVNSAILPIACWGVLIFFFIALDNMLAFISDRKPTPFLFNALNKCSGHKSQVRLKGVEILWQF